MICVTRLPRPRCRRTFGWRMTVSSCRFPPARRRPEMKIARTLQGAAGFGPSAVTIGNFDGTHIGHRRLLCGVVEAAREWALHATVLTFDPHPAAIVTPERPLRLLSTHAERS